MEREFDLSGLEAVVNFMQGPIEEICEIKLAKATATKACVDHGALIHTKLLSIAKENPDETSLKISAQTRFDLIGSEGLITELYHDGQNITTVQTSGQEIENIKKGLRYIACGTCTVKDPFGECNLDKFI